MDFPLIMHLTADIPCSTVSLSRKPRNAGPRTDNELFIIRLRMISKPFTIFNFVDFPFHRLPFHLLRFLFLRSVVSPIPERRTTDWQPSVHNISRSLTVNHISFCGFPMSKWAVSVYLVTAPLKQYKANNTFRCLLQEHALMRSPPKYIVSWKIIIRVVFKKTRYSANLLFGGF